MVYKVNGSDMKLILEAISGTDMVAIFKEAEQVGNGEYQAQQCVVELNNEQIEAVLDLLSDYLIEVGINDDQNINELGYEIEALIDKFSSGI